MLNNGHAHGRMGGLIFHPVAIHNRALCSAGQTEQMDKVSAETFLFFPDRPDHRAIYDYIAIDIGN